MKKIKLLVFIMIGLLVLPINVFAASGSIKVTGTSTAVLGNKVTVTVTLSSKTKIGSWQMDLNYDKSYLKLVSATSEAGGTIMANSSSSGTKSKSYTYTFKTLKKGSTKVSVGSYLAYDFNDLEEIDLSTSSKTIKILTQEELEATYSSNANLKSLSVDGYSISPSFKSSVTEYSLEVENDVESVKISAKEEDSTAGIDGVGTVNLSEGNNKIEIIVTAQKGNRKTYTLNIYRKELDPISVQVKDKNFTIVRKSDAVPELTGFSLTEISYGDDLIPALKNEVTNITLVILKDEEGNIYTYVYDKEIKSRYYELKSNQVVISPLELPENSFTNYNIKEIDYNGEKISGYVLNDDANFAIIYAQDVENAEKNFYLLNLVDNTISKYFSDIDKFYQEKLEIYKYVIFGFVGFSILLLFLLIIKKPSKKQQRKQIKDIQKEEIKKDIEDIKTISKKDQKKLAKEQKKIAKEESKKARKDFDF